MSDTLFISHANEDTGAVEPIVAYLEANGVPCWISSRDIPPRAIYAEAITQGVSDSAACVVIVSRAANESDAIKRELELASHYKKRFIPIRIDATEPGVGLDYYLRNTQWVDYGRERERGLDRIIANMRGAAAQRPARAYTPPPPPPPSYSPPPAPAPPAAQVSMPIGLIVIGALAIAGIGGWFVLSQDRDTGPVLVEDAAIAPPEITAPADSGQDSAAEEALQRQRDEQAARQRDDQEALARERDRALAAAQAAEQQLAYERAQREAAASSQANIANTNWWGTTDFPGLSNISWRFRSDGVACWGLSRGDYSNCEPFTYTRNGNRVVLTNTTNQERWDGTVSGNTYSGTLVAANGERHTFSVYRE